VHAVVDGGRNLDRALDEARSGLPQRAHAELQAWTYGSLRWWPRIERQLAALSARPLAELDRLPLALLGVALFQIQHSPIPAHAIVDESVAATRLIDAARASGFVNAVLRRYLRERPAIDARVLKHPVGRYAHPRWLIEMLQDDWPEDFQHILDAGNEHPPLWLRVNARRQPVAAFEETLVAAGLSAEPSPFVPGALKLSAAVAVDAIPGFAAGAVSVQDAGAQLAALLLDLQAGQRVLDACAAPGGKTGHIAEAAPGLAELVAIDNDPDRVALIRENLERLGLTASLAAADAAQPRDCGMAGHSIESCSTCPVRRPVSSVGTRISRCCAGARTSPPSPASNPRSWRRFGPCSSRAGGSCTRAVRCCERRIPPLSAISPAGTRRPHRSATGGAGRSRPYTRDGTGTLFNSR